MGTKGSIWLFVAATLGASALLFAAQPMVGKMLLPAFGGSPGVWTACLLFFQSALLAGYAYAHLGAARLGPRAQAVLHGALAAAALALLPIRPPAGPPPTSDAGAGPTFWLLGALAASAGLPLALLSATSPLLQRWYALAGGGKAPRDPFFLYAASCAGNLAALAAYPLVVEPLTTLGRQSRAWAVGFAASSALTLLAAAVARPRSGPDGPTGEFPGAPPDAPGGRLGWTWPAALPALWLPALTAHLTTDLAPMPLLWTIPLGAYLVTYIVAFAGAGRRWTRALAPAFPWLASALALVLAAGFVHLAWAPLHLATFFVGALICHGRLAESRPDARRLTAFYLAIGLGGVLGGLACAIVAPALFDRMVEYPLALFLAALAAGARPAGVGLRRPSAGDLAIPAAVLGATWLLTRAGLGDSALGAFALALAAGLGVLAIWRAGTRPLRFALTIGAILLAGGLAPDRGGEVVRRSRNFFGALRVLEDREAGTRRLMHGSTLHGQQSLDPALREEPSTYFTRRGPIGGLLGRPRPGSGARVAVVGLGTGTLACYARPGESWTFYEIDPAVVRAAEDPSCFTYLADARRRGAEVAVVEGDARLRLADAPDGAAAMIVLDAFSSDAVPVHLLSREAIALYRRKLAPGGLLAFNITNRYLDLEPLMARQAEDAGLACRVRYDLDAPAEARARGWQPSIWAVMADLAADLPAGWPAPRPRAGSAPWTDDYSDLASYLILGRRRPPPAAPGP